VKVLGDVNTLQIAPTPENADKEGSKKSSHSRKRASSGGSILSAIAGLIFVAVVIAVIYAVLKSKGVTAQGALQKMGVALPSETDTSGLSAPQPAAPAIDPNVCPFCGQRKDAAGGCACSITPGAAAPIPGPVPTIGPSGPRLIGTQGTFAAQTFPLLEGASVVGREPGCNVALLNDTIASRRHATIYITAGQYSLTDMGSSNGTFVNGARVTEQKLTPGDEVQIGGTKFRFEV
jgi:hypothetical protein